MQLFVGNCAVISYLGQQQTLRKCIFIHIVILSVYILVLSTYANPLYYNNETRSIFMSQRKLSLFPCILGNNNARVVAKQTMSLSHHLKEL